MSLINNALKKAQRQRATDVIDPLSPLPGGRTSASRTIRRGRSLSAQTLVMIGGGVAGLIALSVVVTVLFLREDPLPPALAAESPVQPSPEPIVAPPTTSELAITSFVALKPVAVELPPVAPTIPEAMANAAPPGQLSIALPTASPDTPSASRDESIYAFIDKIKVTGIRSSGADSKVLMNARVYRVNDLVDRSLNLRLTKVEPDSLTFADARGTSYTKKF